MRTVADIEKELNAFEAQFHVMKPAAGTPNRKTLYAAAIAEASRAACLPENVARRNALLAELKAARRSAKARAVAAVKAADPEHRLRQWVYRQLRKLGFRRESKQYGTASAYYARPRRDGQCLRVRISDHAVPLTAERAYNALNGGFTWADAEYIAVETGSRAEAWLAARYLVTVRRMVRREAK